MLGKCGNFFPSLRRSLCLLRFWARRFTHLQHSPFTYTIRAQNDRATAARGTMRIFLSTKFDESDNEWKFGEQRLLMIEMDRFTVHCEAYSGIRLSQ